MIQWQVLVLAPVLFPLLAPPFALGREPGEASDWHYGGYLDLSYAADFNFPANHRWRSKTTTPRVDELAPNMALTYLRKDLSPQSPWGLELGVQGGYDTNALVPAAVPGREQPMPGADTLRHLSRANLSYLAPVGNGLTLTAGLFGSYIGYQSIFSRDNLNYTRTYMADNSPYYMMGAGARYPVSDRFKLGVFVINGYNYLSHVNSQPSYGGQASWNPAKGWTIIQNLYLGPDQAATDPRYWRFFSDSIVEWKDDRLTLAAAYDVGTEQAAEQPGHPQTFWMGAALYAHWKIDGPWSLAARPELYWDRNGRLTGSRQFIRAITTTVEYRLHDAWQTAVLRVEYRYDESTGPQGGYFTGGEIAPGVIGLTPEQQLLLLSVVWSLDS